MTMDIGQAMVKSAEILANAYTQNQSDEGFRVVIGMVLLFLFGIYAVYTNSKMED